MTLENNIGADTAAKLYGDGVHDDAPAIQAMLDSGACEISLPAPEKHYAVGATLRIHGHFATKIVQAQLQLRLSEQLVRPLQQPLMIILHHQWSSLRNHH